MPSLLRSLWSSTKDPALESALHRNRRWIVNNQIKNLLLRSPAQTIPVTHLQARFKTLDLQGQARNWLNKYPSVFQIFNRDGIDHFTFSKKMAALVGAEAAAVDAAEPAMTARLAKILMMSRNHRLNVVKLNEIKKSFGLPDDYLLRLVPMNPDTFRVLNPSGRRNSMEVELIKWDPSLAVSIIQARAREGGFEPRFSCELPESWIRTREKFEEFNHRTPYVSPYELEWVEAEKRAVGVVHEILSLTLWRKLSVMKLGRFWKEFGLPERLNVMLLQHPCIFYVSNRYRVYTVVLREGYRGSELVEKDPLVVAKERIGELMQEGLHEYNVRRRAVNLEKRRKRGEVVSKKKDVGEEDDGEEVLNLNTDEKREERRRFYKVLFGDNK